MKVILEDDYGNIRVLDEPDLLEMMNGSGPRVLPVDFFVPCSTCGKVVFEVNGYGECATCATVPWED